MPFLRHFQAILENPEKVKNAEKTKKKESENRYSEIQERRNKTEFRLNGPTCPSCFESYVIDAGDQLSIAGGKLDSLV